MVMGHRKKRIFLFSFSFSFPVLLFLSFSLKIMAETVDQQEIRLNGQLLQEIVHKGLLFVTGTQAKEDDDLFFKGDFPSVMRLERFFPGLGKKGKKAFDSNVFTNSLVTQSLINIYRRDPAQYNYLRHSIDLGVESLFPYREGDAFAFWRLQRPSKNFENHFLLKNIVLRRSKNFNPTLSLVYLAQNVPVDSDDTQSVYASLILYKKTFDEFKFQFNIPEKIGPIFSAYRDKKRKQFNPFNYFYGGRFIRSTKSFMTWFTDESYSPLGAVPKRNKFYMPFGLNDVDCIVNANILSTLGISGEINDTVGVADSCSYLKKILDTKKEKKCAMYYPNYWQWAHSFLKAYDHGARCLESHLKTMEERLITQQYPDGRFGSYNGDFVYSTALALSGMVRIPHPSEPLKKAIVKSINYLLQQKKVDENNNIYWKSGIFFSGGTVVRKNIIWESDAYATVIIVEALDRYLRSPYFL